MDDLETMGSEEFMARSQVLLSVGHVFPYTHWETDQGAFQLAMRLTAHLDLDTLKRAAGRVMRRDNVMNVCGAICDEAKKLPSQQVYTERVADRQSSPVSNERAMWWRRQIQARLRGEPLDDEAARLLRDHPHPCKRTS